MYSTKCGSCGQLISLKGDDLEAAIVETEAADLKHYQLACPKCRKPVKMPLNAMKLKRPRPVPESLDGRAEGEETAEQAE
jgi:hypothetical protein